MIDDKMNRIQFYSDLKNSFPEIAQLRFWNENDYVNEPFSSSAIMIEIGEIVITWAELNEIEKIQNLMKFLELSYQLYDNESTSCIYTGLLPTLVSMKNIDLREIIKKQFLTETMKHYNQLIDLGFYTEN